MTAAKSYPAIRAKRVEKLLKFLATQHSAEQVAEYLKVSGNTARNLLDELLHEDKVHAILEGKNRYWLAGSGPFLTYAGSFDAPKRKVRKTWPMHNFRDDLVAALFGRPEVCHG